MQVYPTLADGTPATQPPGPHLHVEVLQRALRRAGLDPGPVTGAFNPATVAAIKSFQAANGIVADGVVGPPTWKALPAGDMQGVPTLTQGDSGEAVALLQRTLRRAGFFLNQPIDGDFGATTDAAAKAFQNAMGLIVDGIVGPQTWSELGG